MPLLLGCPFLQFGLRSLVASLGCCAAVCDASGADDGAEVGLPFFESFDPRDYGGHTQVWSAAQDAAGLVYFGNYGGVLVHDGARWDRIDVGGTSFVRGVAIDADDTLWLGGVDELGFARTDATGQRRFVSLADRLPAAVRPVGEVWRVLFTPRGPLFQSNTWLMRWDGSRFATLRLAQAGPWQAIAGGDRVWISHADAGWFTLTDDGTQLALVAQPRPAEFAGTSLVFAVMGAAPGEFIAGTSRAGLVRWDGAAFTPFPTAIDDTLKQRRLYRGARLADGRIVVTTLQAGAFILNDTGRLLASLNEDAGLPDNGAISAFAARDDTLWICLQRGLVRVDARPWVSWFGPARGAPRTALQPGVRFRGEFYVASDAGLLRVAPATANTSARLAPVAGFADELFGLAVVEDELIGFGNTGLFAWRGGERRPLPGAANHTFAFVPAEGQPGRWFALADGGVHAYRRDDGQWHAEGAVPGLHHVRSLAVEPDGTWWMGTPSQGVLRVRFPGAGPESPGAPEILRLTAGNGLPAGHGWARVSVDGRGPLLRCERGLFRFNAARGAFEPTAEFGTRFADGSTTARTIADGSARDGRWFVARPAGEAELVTTLDLGVHGPDGWRPVELPQLARLDDVSDLRYEPEEDVLWIGGHAGLVRLDLAGWRASPPPRPPEVIWRGVETNAGERLPLSGRWRLAYARRSFRVQFAAPSLAGDPGARYESTLLGGGEPVVVTDGEAHREFAALAAGRYVLRVRAGRAEGEWGAPVELAFTILAPWWRSAWAWAAYAALGSAALVGIVAQRTRALRRRAAHLESVVARRTEELRRSNTELARLHQLELDEKTAARLAEEKARLEVLRYQLNPHFLFNAFATLRGLIFQDPPAAGALTLRLSDFCRQSFTRGSESAPVREEIAMLRSYLDAEHARWGDSLQVTFDVTPAALERQLPPFLLLPLVENAIKYGGHTSPELLEVRLALAPHGDDGLAIEVANTGHWLDAGHATVVGPVSTRLGLENLRRRLARHYPDAHRLSVDAADGWVRVRLTLDTSPREPGSRLSRADH